MKPKSCRYLHSELHRQKYGADMSRPDEIFGVFYLGDMHNTYLSLLKKKLSQMCVKKLRGSNSCFPSHLLFQPPTKGGLVVQAVQEEAKGGGAR